jgi:hypothetical protein
LIAIPTCHNLSVIQNLAMKDKARWLELCEQASVEQDQKKLMALVAEITRLLDEKQERLMGPPKERVIRPGSSTGRGGAAANTVDGYKFASNPSQKPIV